jgi:hypothetical protein
MLFIIKGTWRSNTTEEGEREALTRFAAWSPAGGAEMKALYVHADGRGLTSIFEAATPAAIYESLLPFTSVIDYEVVPAMDASESTPILRRARGLD